MQTSIYRRIFVPVDGSEASERGLAEAIRLAGAQGARIRLLHVVDHAELPDAGEGESCVALVLEAMRRNGRAVLERAAAAVRAAGLEPEPLLLENLEARVADVIVEQAERWPADLIVMGTHGCRGASSFFLGSDAEAVARLSRVPVLLVRGGLLRPRRPGARAAERRTPA
jgi:nucleotide-binding universal stress UspA family protein